MKSVRQVRLKACLGKELRDGVGWSAPFSDPLLLPESATQRLVAPYIYSKEQGKGPVERSVTRVDAEPLFLEMCAKVNPRRVTRTLFEEHLI